MPREATPSVEKRRRSIRLGSLIGHGMKFTRYNTREEHRISESDIYSFLNGNDDNVDDESTMSMIEKREKERDGHRVMY